MGYENPCEYVLAIACLLVVWLLALKLRKVDDAGLINELQEDYANITAVNPLENNLMNPTSPMDGSHPNTMQTKRQKARTGGAKSPIVSNHVGTMVPTTPKHADSQRMRIPPKCKQASYGQYTMQMRTIKFRGTMFNYTVGSTEGYGGARRGFANVLHWIASRMDWPVVVDVGGGRGWFASLAGMLGARVYVIEPQPACIQLSRNLAIANGVRDRLVLCHNVASDRFGSVSMPGRACDPTLSIPGKQYLGGDEGEVPSLNLDEILPLSFSNLFGSIALVKIDIGGSSIQILRSLRKTVKEGRVQHIVMKLTPAQWKKAGVSFQNGIEALRIIFDLDFKAYVLSCSHNGLCSDVLSEEEHINRFPTKVHRIQEETFIQWLRNIHEKSEQVSIYLWFVALVAIVN